MQPPNKMSFPKALAWKSHTIVKLGLGEDCKHAQLPLKVHALDQAIKQVGLKIMQLRHRVIRQNNKVYKLKQLLDAMGTFTD